MAEDDLRKTGISGTGGGGPGKAKKYPVVWCEVKVKGRRKPLGVGVCLFGRGVAYAGGLVESIVIRDVYVDDKECEDGSRCLHLSCPRNTTTAEGWLKAHGVKRVTERMKRNFPRGAMGLQPTPEEMAVIVREYEERAAASGGRGVSRLGKGGHVGDAA